MEDHEHRFYMQPKTYTDFVPIEVDVIGEGFYSTYRMYKYEDISIPIHTEKYYERHEYAVLSCNCGEVKRVLVKDA